MENVIVNMTGLPGVGKTTVARMIQEGLEGILIRTGAVRTSNFPEDPKIRYSPEATMQTYGMVLDIAELKASKGKNIVLDGTYDKEKWRIPALDLAVKLNMLYDLVWVKCDDDEIVRKRLLERSNDISEADFNIYLMKKDKFPVPVEEHRVIDNSGTLEETQTHVDKYVKLIKNNFVLHNYLLNKV